MFGPYDGAKTSGTPTLIFPPSVKIGKAVAGMKVETPPIKEDQTELRRPSLFGPTWYDDLLRMRQKSAKKIPSHYFTKKQKDGDLWPTTLRGDNLFSSSSVKKDLKIKGKTRKARQTRKSRKARKARKTRKVRKMKNTRKASKQKKRLQVRKPLTAAAIAKKARLRATGSFLQVYRGSKIYTKGGLTKKDLTKNKKGRIVSIKQQRHNPLRKWVIACKQAKKELGFPGFVPLNKGEKGKKLYIRAKAIYTKMKAEAKKVKAPKRRRRSKKM